MQASQIPVKFPIPFAADAGSGFIRPIPVASQITITPGAASLTDGFPPLNFLAEGSGGIPPFGQDENGILNQITAWSQWQNAGAAVTYDSSFSTAISGYPKGSLLYAAAGGFWWLSTVDNNVTDPDTGGAGWQVIASGQVYAGNPNGNVAGFAGVENFLSQSFLWDTVNKILWLCTTTGSSGSSIWTQLTGIGTGAVWCGSSSGTANAQSISVPNNVITLTVGTSLSWEVGAGLTNTGALTLAVGGFGTIPVYKESITGPVVLIGGEVVAGNILTGTYDGTHIQLTSVAQGTAAKANASSNTGNVSAMFGTSVANTLPVFKDTTGTIEQGPTVSSSTGNVAAVSGSTVSGHVAVFADSNGTVADGGLFPTFGGAVISTSQAVSPGVYYVDTTGGVVTLTLNSVLSGAYTFIDASNYWGINNLILNGNGNNIGGGATLAIASANSASTFTANASDYQFSIEALSTFWRLV